MTDSSTNSFGEIVEPNNEHLHQMVEIFKDAQNYHHDSFPEIFSDINNSDDERTAIENYLQGYFKPGFSFRNKRRSNFSYAIVSNNIVHGYLLYNLKKSSDIFFGKDRWSCFVEDIATAESYRGKGVASRLIDRLMTEIADLENCRISAQVWRGNNSSIKLFEKFGFDQKSSVLYRTLK